MITIRATLYPIKRFLGLCVLDGCYHRAMGKGGICIRCHEALRPEVEALAAELGVSLPELAERTLAALKDQS